MNASGSSGWVRRQTGDAARGLSGPDRAAGGDRPAQRRDRGAAGDGPDDGEPPAQSVFEDRKAGLAGRPRSRRPRVFSLSVVVEIRALVCERPTEVGLPL